MKKEIIVDVDVDKTRVAVLEDEYLTEIYIEHEKDKSIVGNIYVGKITSILPGIQAAFIDIGIDKNAYIYVDDAITNNRKIKKGDKPRIESIISSGQEIVVQVTKESFGDKGPKVTSKITLPGRLLVYLPHTEYLGISKKIDEDIERERLKEIALSIKPEGVGLIVRTEGEGKDLEDFKEDLEFLTKNWTKINKQTQKGKVPRCIHEELCLTYKTIRDIMTKDTKRFVINSSEDYEKAKEIAVLLSDSMKKKIEYFNKDYSIFEYYHIESQLREALAKKVWLKSGGYLIFDKTEALTVVDVNTGKYIGKKSLEETVLRTNIEAANEIARQLRIRDIGGIIIIDFIDMKLNVNKAMLIEILKELTEKDKTKTTVVGMTGLGLIEITRKKVRNSLLITCTKECPLCKGQGRITK